MIDPRFQVQLPRSPSKQRNPTPQVKQAAISVAVNPVSDDEIRIYAYELYEHRGGTGDRAVEDWLAAEAYLAARKNRANKVIG
jgi:Protein of unknown function (DUF2934)